ncbi:MAG TPA: N-6 DNA methylase, partial [Urbifossiella sp.]
LAAILGLPVLNGDLFAPQALDECSISNRDLLGAFWHLAWYRDSKTAAPRRVNYAALDVEELGSVYESLLEFHPAIDRDTIPPRFQLLFGSERKSTGSYYTPPELVAELIRSALDPVIRDRLEKAPKDRAAALLGIRVCDPACGSGHFLLAAARRLGKELARARTGEDEPAPERVREAVRDAIAHCIYGVDKNPLAVDLCRVALWLEGHAAAKPLTFLDHRVRCGDALVGVFDLNVLKEGIPEKAFEPLEGDDKPFARGLKKQNRDDAKDLIWLKGLESPVAALTAPSRELDTIADDSPQLIRQKKRLFESRTVSPLWRKEKLACDLWTAAFFQPLKTENAKRAITSAHVSDCLSGRHPVPEIVEEQAATISRRQRFFHWPLEFPEVFSDGGFDAILSNPPWERVKLQEQEFFGVRDAKIATAPNKAARTRLIKELPASNPELHQEFSLALRAASAGSAFMRHGGRFPLAGRGDINTYAVFAELASKGIRNIGGAGMILPTGIATDDTTKILFGSFVGSGRLLEMTGYENEEFIFPAVHHAFKFCTLTIGGLNSVEKSRIAFYIRKFAQLNEGHRFFSMEKKDFWLLNPNTGNCPIFRTQADAELTKAIYRRVPILWKEGTAETPEENPWRLSFKTLFHMANDSHLFKTADDLRGDGFKLRGNIYEKDESRFLPLYEAKMLHQFDHRFSTYDGATEKQLNVGILPQPTAEQKRDPNFVVQPRYWVAEADVKKALPKYPKGLASALEVPAKERKKCIQHVFMLWLAGFNLNRGNVDAAKLQLDAAARIMPPQSFSGMLATATADMYARDLERDYPLSESDVQAITAAINDPEELAEELVERFSPKWLMGWRNITNTTNERSFIMSILPLAAIGHSFPLVFCELPAQSFRLVFAAAFNSFICDYIVRQKLGGTNMTYHVIRQIAFITSISIQKSSISNNGHSLACWFLERTLEFVFTANDMIPLARDCGYEGPPFVWDDERRFEIRAELDAAFFHLYLPCLDDGSWKPAENETPEQLAELKKHFPTPRDAVGYIMDQFPIVRQKDEKAHGRYRTKERILEIYDALLAAQRTGQPYQTRLNPPPGEQQIGISPA